MADITTDVNQSRAMRIARRRVEGFAEQFGEAHRNLCRHAAFPLVLTPDLLYQIWANFVPEAPWVAVAHVLLSRLCRQVGYEMYEMDIADRNLLLRELKEEFGQERFDELGEFLLDYVAQRLTDDDVDTRDLREAQEWTALAYTKPDEAARELAQRLSEMVQQEDMGEVLRLASLVETLAEPLMENGFEPLLVYSRSIGNYARDNRKIAATDFELLAGWEQQIIIAGVPLFIPTNRSRNINLQNPFFVGKPVPPEHFVGRKSEITAAFDQIHNRSHLAIWGAPGMGKTSFLEKLADSQTWEKYGLNPSYAVIVLLNCKTIFPFTPSGFWREVLNLLKDKLDDKPTLKAKIAKLIEEGKTTKDSLRQILRAIGKQNRFLVLLIDDYDAALHENQQYTQNDMEKFLSECRNLLVYSQEKEYLSMIVTSLKRLNELGPQLGPTASPWYNHYLFLRLKPFDNIEISESLRILQKAELLESVRDITGGNPSLLQIAGFLLYRNIELAKQSISTGFIEEFSNIAEPLFQNIWNCCTEIEKILLTLLALLNLKEKTKMPKLIGWSDFNIIISQRERQLSRLEEIGVILHKINNSKTIYYFTSSIMEQWVIKTILHTDEEWLKQKEKVLITLISRQGFDNFKKTIKWLWANPEEVSKARKVT